MKKGPFGVDSVTHLLNMAQWRGEGKQHPDRISTTETGPFPFFVNDTTGLRVVWSCFFFFFVNGRGPRADSDLVDRVTSAGIQDLVG